MLFTATSRTIGVGANGIGPYAEANGLMPLAPTISGPIAIRYPRGAGIGVALADKGFRALPIGQGEMMRDGKDAVILGVGPLLYDASKLPKIWSGKECPLP